MKLKYYVTEWNPNGTNDLLIADESGDVVNSVSEATFGINTKDSGLFLSLGQWIESVHVDDYDPEMHCQIKEISYMDLLTQLAISPCDPDGVNKVQEIKNAILDATNQVQLRA